MRVGFWELLVVLVVALLVIGPEKLPVYMKSLGKGMASLKNAASEMSSDLQNDVIEPLNEAARPLREAVEPVTELTEQINTAVKDTEKSFREAAVPSSSKVKKEVWKCPVCGESCTGKFCSNCGSAKKEKEEIKEADAL